MHFFKTLQESSKELKKLNNLLISAMLLALCVVVGLMGTFMIGPFIRISFTDLPIALGSMLFGPVVGGIMGALSDILNFIISPKGPYFPGFTISGILTGLIYGFAFYKKKATLSRIVITKAILIVLVDMLLNTYWLSILMGKGFIILFADRLVKNIIMLPVHAAMLYVILNRLPVIINRGKHTK
ncbi:folate family ECF transporter S component [Anaerocolumna chitinilytica]|uniref:Folate ECF transporter n=1 Tax=Anaerocolumna chitinilytica TaxID=1727145 RepID=A0A7I8DMR0_9FIRM|nr:folate family ECF transporter S component [Anaerocolumna chitinilytica]BCJ99698.1 folate ECF transporter [Anaerocolumna chitinilytica]